MKYIFIRPQKLSSMMTELSHNSSLELLVRSIAISLGLLSALTLSASAEITATTGAGSTGTAIAPSATANTTDIKGGQKSSDNKNLFHSFGTFNVKTGEVANFKPDAGIQNILGRVTGGAPSLVDGKLQVNGGVINPPAVNLFLMNPAGIVFGKGASLDINGAFTATTAKAIGFDNGKWFNAIGDNKYTELTGNPISLAFTGSTQGSIVSAATFDASDPDPTKRTTKPGKSITLVGGTVISTGDIKTAGGNISIATVKNGQYVEIKVEGSILSLQLPTANSINPEAKSFKPSDLATLLTPAVQSATGVTEKNGVVKLSGDTRSILPGDIVTKNLNTSGNPNGGNVSLNTQAGDIIVNSIDTSSQGFDTGGKGGDVNVNAGGIFRAIGFTERDSGNFTVTNSINKNPVSNNTGISIFTGGNLGKNATESKLGDKATEPKPGDNLDTKDLLGGKINITFQGEKFLTGGKIIPSPGDLVKLLTIPLELDLGFTFPEGVSGTKGAVVSRNSNGRVSVTFRDGAFVDQNGMTVPAGGGFGVAGDGGGGQAPNSDEQASKPKSKENCTPSSTSVASNPTAAPTRSAGNPNAVSADPCQPNTSNNGILQILTDRE